MRNIAPLAAINWVLQQVPMKTSTSFHCGKGLQLFAPSCAVAISFTATEAVGLTAHEPGLTNPLWRQLVCSVSLLRWESAGGDSGLEAVG